MKTDRQILKSVKKWSCAERLRAFNSEFKDYFRLTKAEREAINSLATRTGIDSIQAAYQWGYAEAMVAVSSRIGNEMIRMEAKNRMSEIDKLFNDPKAREIIFSKVAKLVGRP